MSQGTTIKGKTDSGLNLEVRVDSQGQIYIANPGGGGGGGGSAKPTDAYGINNTEDTGTYKYFGFEDSSGAWYIMRKTIATNTYQYAKGASNYLTAWTNRASQTYDTYGGTF